jgi:predicted CXXCH cytochrome family protein
MKVDRVKNRFKGLFVIASVILLLTGEIFALDITSTKHNLSVTGPGPIKALPGAEPSRRICVYCHTPHRANPDTPLWNHTLSPRKTYILPESPTQLSKPSNPPDGDSRLCLSCHDGMVAIGSVVHMRGGPTTISMQRVGPRQEMVPTTERGLTNLAGDLSGTHLISIAYNDDLKVDKDKQCQTGIVYFGLRYPSEIPPPVRLRPTDNTYNGKPGYKGLGVQCSSCHEPHDNGYGKFLLVDYFNNPEDLCLSCHTYNCSQQ